MMFSRRLLHSIPTGPRRVLPLLALLVLTPVFDASANTGAMDHSLFLMNYNGPQTCEGCHPGSIAEIQATVHYKFESPVPGNYLYDEEGNPLEIRRSGKLWKLCGFPTSVPQFNWVGSLKDDPATPHIDKPGGCGRCHIGIGMKPYTMTGQTEPQESDNNNIDCLVCHAENYSRKFYTAQLNGEPEVVNGNPVVLAVPKADGVIDWNSQLEAAQSVGLPKSEYCLRCHASAGGGRTVDDNHEYSFKRGSVFDAESDVHAAMGMSCVDCHSAGAHKTKRSLNNDLYAYDTPQSQQLCVDCHTETPHETETGYNTHASFVACTTCHATSFGGAVYKDFSDVIAPDPSDPLGLYGVRVDHAGPDWKIKYRWFNGTVRGEITPYGARGDGKIYPYKDAAFNQPVDANGHPVPLKWGIAFKTGDIVSAANTGRSLYEAMYTEELGAMTGLPPVPGEFDHYAEHNCVFSLSHSITKENALRCVSCHSTNSVLDFQTLGFSAERAQELMTLDVPGGGTDVSSWQLY